MNPVLSDLVTSSASKLFEHYELPVDIEQVEEQRIFRYAGVLGFTGDGIKGTMVVSASGPAIEATFPDGGTQADREDWVGEICNQLLGRVANKIIGYGLSIRMSTPVTFSGKELSMQRVEAPEQRGWLLRGPGEADVYVHLAAEVEDHITWETAADAEDAPEEGDLMLF
jgi:hypothetical protein